jgi:autotransporter translocation and assembly factor TamB
LGTKLWGTGRFFLPIQVLNRELRAESIELSPTAKQVGIFTDGQSYGANESIKLNIMATDSQGKAINANLSVSVLDLNQASLR